MDGGPSHVEIGFIWWITESKASATRIPYLMVDIESRNSSQCFFILPPNQQHYQNHHDRREYYIIRTCVVYYVWCWLTDWLSVCTSVCSMSWRSWWGEGWLSDCLDPTLPSNSNLRVCDLCPCSVTVFKYNSQKINTYSFYTGGHSLLHLILLHIMIIITTNAE